jgi:2-polyprenyl-3-methyl-5-hydroxy-6-metoxy-1,4-benzoquinol methylase
MNTSVELNEIPFYWRNTDERDSPANPVANTLPFTFESSPDGIYIRRKPDELVENALQIVYRFDENVGYLPDGTVHASTYGQDFLRFVQRLTGSFPPPGRRCFEIGSGGGWLLKNLANEGWIPISCDPSPTARRAARTNNYEHIDDFYDTVSDYPEVDVVVHYDVLEHVEDPIGFLKAHTRHLRGGGLLLLGTPDCTKQMDLADVSMAIHEHRNYFSSQSLTQVVKAAGFKVLEVSRGDVGGVLYCAAVWDKNEDEISNVEKAQLIIQNSTWITNANQSVSNVRQKISSAVDKGDCVGLFVPLRAFAYAGPFLSIMNAIPIDDDPNIIGKYFDGLSVPISSSSILDTKKFALILAMTTSFHNQLIRKIRTSRLNDSTNVVTPFDLRE